MSTIKISDLIDDCPLILIENTGKQIHYFELKWSGASLGGFNDAPVQIFLKKGKRITKKELHDVL